MNAKPNNTNQPNGPPHALPMQVQAFRQWGVDEVAYVRPIVVGTVTAFAIHAADGRRIGVADSLDLALAAIVQHETEPVALH